MKPEFLPATQQGRMDRLAEECAEVIQELMKANRFGLDTTRCGSWSGVAPRERILTEIADLEHAIAAVKADLKDSPNGT